MPRTKEFDPDQALDSAMELFWEQGYDATSMQDLVDHMGINRFSLYDTFGNKHELYLRALDRYREKMGGTILEQLASSDEGIGAIRAYFTTAIEHLMSRGGKKACLMVNSLAEKAADDREVRQCVMRNVKSLQSAFGKAVQRAQALGEIDAARDATELAQFLTTHLIGLNALAKGERNRKRLERDVELTIDFLR